MKELAVYSEELTLIGWHLELVENSFHRTNRLAVGTVDACFPVDMIHVLIICSGDAMHRTNLQT